MTVEAKKQSNRAIQRTHATYKKKSEISEALNEIRPHINVSTYKFLSHFLHTDGTGVTQIKISEWCKKVGISLGSYHKTVKPEIENTLGQSLIIKVSAPMKYDAKRKMKVKASEFKSLLPISVIKHLIKQKEQEEKMQLDEIFEEIAQIEIEGEIEGEIKGEIESDGAIPCESKDEGAFLPQQNKSFREKPLEKSIKIFKKESIIGVDSFIDKKVKTYALKKEVKAILNQGILKALNDEQRQEFGNRIQIALKRTGSDIKDEEIQDTIYDACNGFIMTYEKNPNKLENDYYGTLYVCIENAIFGYLVAQEQGETEENDADGFEYMDDIEIGENEGKHGYNGEYYHENKQREALKEIHLARTQMAVSKEELNELGVY